jgi:hypothetical protein
MVSKKPSAKGDESHLVLSTRICRTRFVYPPDNAYASLGTVRR